jgi:nicotinate phosphoribosyltransferase
MKHGLMPMGTSAHEMFMVLAGLSDQSDDAIRNSHQDFLNLWWDQYGYGLSIALTDTFGSEFFFKDMTSWQAAQWKGLRHDSGNPYVFGENTINFYKSKGVDPKEKMIVFSDGLDVDKIVHLADFFNGKIKTSFGWGTNLTNDLGLGALSLVVKPVAANGVPLVKLSDNLAKAMGDPATVERYKRVFGYTNESTIECRY